MKFIKFVLVFIFLNLFSFYCFAFQINENWQLDVTNDFQFIYNSARGPGKGNSFLYRGNHGLSYEDRLDLLNRLNLGDVSYEFDIDTRFTNNEKIDMEDVSPKKIYLQRNSPTNFWRLGDFFANFSQYSLNQNIKGGILNFKESTQNPWDITAIAGTYKIRWEYMWNDESDELKNIYFYGTRLGRKFGTLQTYLNYVFTDQNRLGDVSDNTSRSSTEIVHNHLTSMDWRFMPSTNLDLSGESAFSRQHSSTNDNIDRGFAHKILGRLRIKNLRTQLEYERTPSDFHTPGGSASTDRERYRIRNNYYMGNNEIFVNYTSYWDNIQGTLAYTTKVKMPEVGTTIRNIFNRKSLSGNLSLRQRRRHRNDNSLDERTSTITTSLDDRFGPFMPGFDYEYRRLNPTKSVNDSGERTHSLGLRLNSYHRTALWTLRPTVSVRFEQTKDMGADINADRGTNKDWIWSGGLSGNFKSDLRFNLSYMVSKADNYIVDTDTRRRVLRFSLDYNIGGNKDNILGIEFQDNRNHYNNTSNNYDENVLNIKWTRRF